MPDLRAFVSQARRAIARYRRVLGALFAAAAVLAIIESLAPAPATSRQIVVAARDLGGGTRLVASDLKVVSMPPALVPAGASIATSAAVGRVLAGPVRAGEVMTDLRLVGRRLVARYPPGIVAVPVRIADTGITHLLAVGDHIDVFAAISDATAASLVLADAPVLALPEAADSDQEGGLVVVGASLSEAAALAAASATGPLSLALLR